ncbi:MAG TPA: transcriptional regulator [Spirochaetaceae bacterium]|nr:transcriptional regulator [Spirochaetaceae bacterium]
MPEAGMIDSILADNELVILESIYASLKTDRSLTQRDLAQTSGMSLGMTNVLLKRFAEKGWVMLRKLNSRTMQYVLTPVGLQELAHRAYRYFQRTTRNLSKYKNLLEAFVSTIKLAGKKRLVLLGCSDIDFILEYSCERYGMLFVKSALTEKLECLADEYTVLVAAEGPPHPPVILLADILFRPEAKPVSAE